MRKTTGIELGPDSCVMVAARARRGGTDVSAVHTVQPAEWPLHDLAATAVLRDVRRAKRLPRTAAVIVWGLPEDASVDEPSTRAAVRPVTAAGFTVGVVMTPAQALAALAFGRARPDGGGAVAWLALNTYGAAIAIVRGTDLLFSRTFTWSFRQATGSKGQQLQRYSIVAHLAPEVRRGIAHVLATHGARVETAVTCGDLPELRSLTMPLIEELRIEVETLDSMDGLRAVGRPPIDGFPDSAPAIRLAAAVATAPRRSPSWMPLLRAAAVVAAIAGLGWAAFALRPRPEAAPMQPAPSQTLAAAGSSARQPVPDAVVATRAVTAKVQPARPLRRRSLLTEPVPIVDSILIDRTRRLAVVAGVIVRAGDRVGSRTVIRIEDQAVVFEEPSGRKVSSALSSTKLSRR